MVFRSNALLALVFAIGFTALPVAAGPQVHVIKKNITAQLLPLPTPVLPVLQVPVLGGGFSTIGTTAAPGTYEVLPLFGSTPMVRVFLSEDADVLHVHATPARGASIAIPEAPAGSSLPAFFNVISVDRSKSPAQWLVQIQLPVSFVGLSDYTIAVSGGSAQHIGHPPQRSESAPLNFRLLGQLNYNLAVVVIHNGTVFSGPAGINCSSGGAGHCTHGFAPASGIAPVTVTLRAVFGADISFGSWSGSCSGTSPTCTVTLGGFTPASVTATFVDNSSSTGSTCTAPAANVGNKTYADMPECTPSVGATFVAQCDAAGYFCCEPQIGASSQRCGGQGKHEFPADCMQNQHYSLQQPGGCYQ